MPVPETTSAEAFARYVGGKVLRVGRGKAWGEIQVFTMALPRVVELGVSPHIALAAGQFVVIIGSCMMAVSYTLSGEAMR